MIGMLAIMKFYKSFTAGCNTSLTGEMEIGLWRVNLFGME